MEVPLLCKVNTDRQETHVCLEDSVFCMGEAKRGCGGEDGGRRH